MNNYNSTIDYADLNELYSKYKYSDDENEKQWIKQKIETDYLGDMIALATEYKSKLDKMDKDIRIVEEFLGYEGEE